MITRNVGDTATSGGTGAFAHSSTSGNNDTKHQGGGKSMLFSASINAVDMPRDGVGITSFRVQQLGHAQEHLDLVISWYQDAWGHVRPQEPEYSANLLRTRLATNATLPIAYIVFTPNASIPIATFTLTPNINGIGDAKLILLNNIYVAKEYRGRGVGIQVVKMAERIAREQFQISTLQLFITNLTLERLYIKLGWTKRESTYLKTVTGDVPAIVFTKNIANSASSKL